MKKTLFISVAICLIGFSSCKKIWDYIDDHHDGAKENSRIERIYYTERFVNIYEPDGAPPLIFDDTADFKYNKKNQLTAVEYAAGRAHLAIEVYPPVGLIFFYDAAGRLEIYFDQAKYYREDLVGAQLAHKYTYVNESTIIDSTFSYAEGTVINGKLVAFGGNPFDVVQLTLDEKRRIIKADAAVFPDEEYSYDENGNLVMPGIAYTNKKNVYQTDTVLQFVARDYSINTAVGSATEFNNNKLPVKLNAGKLPFLVRNTIGSPDEFYDKQNIHVFYTKK